MRTIERVMMLLAAKPTATGTPAGRTPENPDAAPAPNAAELLANRQAAQEANEPADAPIHNRPLVVPNNPKNRLNNLIESVTFAVSKTQRVYPDKQGTGSSMGLASVVLTYVGGFVGVPGTIYARKATAEAIPTISFSFASSRSAGSALEPLDTQAGGEITELNDAICDSFAEWWEKSGGVVAGQKKGRTVKGLNF